jgi:hypothetical protein
MVSQVRLTCSCRPTARILVHVLSQQSEQGKDPVDIGIRTQQYDCMLTITGGASLYYPFKMLIGS